VLAEVRPDVVYAWRMGGVSIAPLLAAQDRGLPVVLRLTDYWLKRLRVEISLEPIAVKRIYRAALLGLGGFGRLDTSMMLPNSRTLMQSYVQAGFSAESMEVVPNGVRADLVLEIGQLRRLPTLSEGREVKLLFVGRLSQEKAPDIAILALHKLIAELGCPQARLDIIGTGAEGYEAQLRDMARNLGLADKIRFVGHIEHNQLLECYLLYDALLFTSRWEEPFGRVVIEAMARGLPVIATNRGGPTEVIANGENGLLVPPDDPLTLAKTVKRLFENPALAERLRRSARETLLEDYDLDRFIGRVEQHLEAAIRKPLVR
jgi:glycosyltransferase involved in cell wall biosynthesis